MSGTEKHVHFKNIQLMQRNTNENRQFGVSALEINGNVSIVMTMKALT